MKDNFKNIRILLKELVQSQKKTDEQLKKTDAEISKTHDEISKLFRKTDAEIDKTNKMVAHLIHRILRTNGWGRFVEGFMAPAAEDAFDSLGYKTEGAGFRKEIKENGEVVGEIDIIIPAYKDEHVVFMGGAKSYVSSQDVDDFIENLIKARKNIYEYRDYKIVGFIGGMNFGEGADSYTMRKGLYVFKPSGETMELAVPKGFKPKIWK